MVRHTQKNLPVPPERLERIRELVAENSDRFIESRFKIPNDDSGQLCDFKFRWPQRKAYDIYKEKLKSDKPVRLWFLKSRRVGLTSLFAADDLADAWSRDNRRVGIVAHNDERARRILAMCKSFHRRLPIGLQLPLSKDATAGLKFADHDSELIIGTCKEPEKVRGDGLHRAHLSEAAYYKKNYQKVLDEVAMTIAPAKGTVAIIETTGRARGSSAHKHWQSCVDGHEVFEAVFLDWKEDPTCVVPFTDDVHKKDIGEEMQYFAPRLVEKNKFYNLTPEQSHWTWIQYLYKANKNYELFCTEFPYDIEEAWSASGALFFGANEVNKAKADKNFMYYIFEGRHLSQPFTAFTELEQAKEVLEEGGELFIKLWATPNPSRQYILAADSSYGEEGSSFSAGYVIDKKTREMMCSYHGRIRPDEHAVVMASLGKMYNTCMVCPEANPGGGGMTILDYLYRLGYYNIYQWRYRDSIEGHDVTKKAGWWTNSSTRMIALSELRKMFQDIFNNRFPDPGMFKDSGLINEMRGFYTDDETGRPEASEQSYDDRIFALAIAHQVAADETKGTSSDIYSSYEPKTEDPGQKLLDQLDQMESRFDEKDPCDIVRRFKHGDFSFNEGEITWQTNLYK